MAAALAISSCSTARMPFTYPRSIALALVLTSMKAAKICAVCCSRTRKRLPAGTKGACQQRRRRQRQRWRRQ
jgi:hypothetical protein